MVDIPSIDQRYGPPPPPQSGSGYRGFNQDHYRPEAVFVNAAPRSREDISVSKMSVPVIMFFGVLSVVGVGSFTLAVQFSDLGYKIDAVKTQLSNQIERMTGTLENRITRVEQDAAMRMRDRWTKSDHELWCAKTERVNKGGWRCAESVEINYGEQADQKNLRIGAPATAGWEARTK